MFNGGQQESHHCVHFTLPSYTEHLLLLINVLGFFSTLLKIKVPEGFLMLRKNHFWFQKEPFNRLFFQTMQPFTSQPVWHMVDIGTKVQKQPILFSSHLLEISQAHTYFSYKQFFGPDCLLNDGQYGTTNEN